MESLQICPKIIQIWNSKFSEPEPTFVINKQLIINSNKYLHTIRSPSKLLSGPISCLKYTPKAPYSMTLCLFSPPALDELSVDARSGFPVSRVGLSLLNTSQENVCHPDFKACSSEDYSTTKTQDLWCFLIESFVISCYCNFFIWISIKTWVEGMKARSWRFIAFLIWSKSATAQSMDRNASKLFCNSQSQEFWFHSQIICMRWFHIQVVVSVDSQKRCRPHYCIVRMELRDVRTTMKKVGKLIYCSHVNLMFVL